MLKDLVERSERHERAAEVEAQVDGLLHGRAGLGQMREGPECLLERRHGLPVCRLREGLGPGLAAVGDGPVPHLSPQGVVGQPLDLRHPVGSERLHGRQDPRVEGPPVLPQQAPIGHL